MIKIYHNNRCRKSREAVQYLTEKKLKFTINFSDNNKKNSFRSLKQNNKKF